MLGKTAALTDINQNPYQPYQGQQVAGLSPLQQQAMGSIGGQQVSSQLGGATNLAMQAGQGGLAAQQNAMGLQGTALGYGQAGAGYGAAASQFGAEGAMAAQQAAQRAQRQAGMYGAQGMQYGAQGAGIGGMGVQQAQQGFGAGAQYAQQATSPEAMGQYMSPYMQNVVAQQQKEAVRQADIARQGTQAQAVRSGAFGGSRGAIVEAENQRGLQDRLAMIQATGTQSAYDKAQQAQQFGANLGLQGLQAGYQGLQTGLQGTAQGMQGAQTGLQGVGQQLAGGQLGLSGAGMGIQGQQAGMQGTAQGLSGVQAATGAGQYGLSGLGAAGSAASTLGALGQTQFGQEQAINQAQMQAGALQQAQQQRGLDVAYQQYQDQLNYPYKQLAFQSDMFRGLPLSQSATTMYQNTGAMAPQLLGAGIAAYGATQRAKEGGLIKGYAEGGTTTVDPSVPSSIGPQALSSRLAKLSDEQLMAYARTVKDAVALAEVKGEIQRRQEAREPQGQMPSGTVAQGIAPSEEAMAQPAMMAGGGIVALAEGTTPQIIEDLRKGVTDYRAATERQRLLSPERDKAGKFGYFTTPGAERVTAAATLSALQNAPIEDLRAYRATGVLPGSEDPSGSPAQMTALEISNYKQAQRDADRQQMQAQGQQMQAQDADSQVQPSEALEYPLVFRRDFERENENLQMQDADSQVQPTGVSPNAPPGTVPGGIVPSRAPVAGAPVAGAPTGQAPAAPTGSTGIVPSSKAPTAMAGGAVPIANPGDPMGWGAYKANVDDFAKLDPEQKAVLDDMRKRTERRMSRAEKQEKGITSDVLIAGGLAMMGGFNLPDGARRFAEQGGKKYFESSADARKAIEAADDAQGAFDQYQLSLKQGNKKVAAEMYGKFHNSMMDFNGKILSANISAGASREATAEAAKSRTANMEMQERRYDLDRDSMMQRHQETILAQKDNFKARMDELGENRRVLELKALEDRELRLIAEARATEKGIYDRFAPRLQQFEFKLGSGKPLNPADQKAYDALVKEFNAEAKKAAAPVRKKLDETIIRQGEVMGISAPSSAGSNSGFRVVGVR
jgi:hypothetical protein